MVNERCKVSSSFRATHLPARLSLSACNFGAPLIYQTVANQIYFRPNERLQAVHDSLCFHSSTVQGHPSIIVIDVQASMVKPTYNIYDGLSKEELKLLVEWLCEKVLCSKSTIFELKTSMYWEAHRELTAFIVEKGGWDGATQDAVDFVEVKELMARVRLLMIDEGVLGEYGAWD